MTNADASRPGSADLNRPQGAGSINWQRELECHDRSLRAVVWSRLRNAHDVDEVMQEVALAAVRQQAPITDAGRVGAWLYRLAVMQSLMFRRRMGRQRGLRKRFAERKEVLGDERGEPDPLGWLLSQERRAMVRQAMRGLPTRDAEILMLKYTENLSYQQIAELLEMSTAAVESRLHRARAKLRAALAELQITTVEA
jgi:RNA polymerase sigma-70 factor (ECF subfamily)